MLAVAAVAPVALHTLTLLGWRGVVHLHIGITGGQKLEQPASSSSVLDTNTQHAAGEINPLMAVLVSSSDRLTQPWWS